MRPEERHWMNVSLTIGFVSLTILLLIILGLTLDINHLYDSLTHLFE